MAGNKKGQNDNRYLWPEFYRLVGELRPRWVVAENVAGILRISAETVCTDLEREGYSVGIWDFEAAAVGARHRRERIFFVAHARCSLRQRLNQQGDVRAQAEERLTVDAELPSGAYAANANRERCEEQQQSIAQEPAYPITGCGSRRELEPRLGGVVNGLSAGLDGDRLNFWEAVPEPTDRIAHGTKDRVNRLKALGNAVVPQQAYPVFRAVIEADRLLH